MAWRESRRLRGSQIAGLVWATSSCVPIPSPSTVRVDEPPAIEPARLNAPASSEVLACVGRSLVEERADVRLVEAGPVWSALGADSQEDISIEAMLADEGACGQMESDADRAALGGRLKAGPATPPGVGRSVPVGNHQQAPRGAKCHASTSATT